MSELLNVHWYRRMKLEILRKEGKLFRGRNGSVPIHTSQQLTAQIIRKSVWTHA